MGRDKELAATICSVRRANDVEALPQVSPPCSGSTNHKLKARSGLSKVFQFRRRSTLSASIHADMQTIPHSAPSRPGFSHGLLVAAAILALSFVVAPTLAQQPARPPVAGPQNRADLDAEATRLEQVGQNGADSEKARAEAARIRARLRDGDFNTGDRVVVKVDSGVFARADTFVVREGKMVEFPGLPPITLTGVLHAEISDYLTQQLSRYFRDPKVQAYPLLRVAIFGPVGSPGYYTLPADLLLSDAIMSAGGPGSTAKMDETVVKRGEVQVIDKRDMQRALVYGYTLSQMNIRDGDAIHVGGVTRRNWTNVLRAMSIAIGLGFTVHRISKGF